MQGDDSVVSCSLASPTSTTIVAKFSYNEGYKNTPIVNVSSDKTFLHIGSHHIKYALICKLIKFICVTD